MARIMSRLKLAWRSATLTALRLLALAVITCWPAASEEEKDADDWMLVQLSGVRFQGSRSPFSIG